MSIIKEMSDRVHYYLDSINIKVTGLKVKIEHFILNQTHDNIIVVYRLGRQKLLNKMNLTQFEKEYFEKVSNYDQHRLTKFSTLQHMLQILFANSICNKKHFTHFVEEHIKNEQLF
jgi:hypothetical protein